MKPSPDLAEVSSPAPVEEGRVVRQLVTKFNVELIFEPKLNVIKLFTVVIY